MFDDDRYARQRRLPEIGDAGQRRIFAAVIEVAGSDGAIVEADYLQRAGVERLSLVPRVDPEPFAHAEHFVYRGPTEVAAGAWRALAKLRRIVLGEAP